jgi:hypothetical protein
MNLPPTVWGPFFWLTIHITALAYPTKPSYTDKRAAKQFFESLANLLPCPVCREHYKQHLTKLPLLPHLDNRKDLFKWTVDLHNSVNATQGKPQWTVEEAINYIKLLGERQRSPIITGRDFSEQHMESFLKGILIGGGAVAAGAAILYWLRGSSVRQL